MIRGVIFDLDGTLLESMGVWENLGESFLAARGISPPPGLRDTLWPMSMEECAQYFINTFRINDSIDNIIDEIGAQISEAYRCDVIAKPGALELLTALKKADFPIALATATGRDIFTPAITRLGMDRFFDYIITCSEIGASKQSAKIYNSCALKFNLPACDIVVFEDALYAAKTAKSAGYTLVGVHDKYAENDTAGLLEISDRYVNSLEELL